MAAHACGMDGEGGWGRCARARAGAGGARAPPDSFSASLPAEQREEVVDPEGLRVRRQGKGPDPAVAEQQLLPTDICNSSAWQPIFISRDDLRTTVLMRTQTHLRNDGIARHSTSGHAAGHGNIA